MPKPKGIPIQNIQHFPPYGITRRFYRQQYRSSRSNKGHINQHVTNEEPTTVANIEPIIPSKNSKSTLKSLIPRQAPDDYAKRTRKIIERVQLAINNGESDFLRDIEFIIQNYPVNNRFIFNSNNPSNNARNGNRRNQTNLWLQKQQNIEKDRLISLGLEPSLSSEQIERLKNKWKQINTDSVQH